MKYLLTMTELSIRTEYDPKAGCEVRSAIGKHYQFSDAIYMAFYKAFIHPKLRLARKMHDPFAICLTTLRYPAFPRPNSTRCDILFITHCEPVIAETSMLQHN